MAQQRDSKGRFTKGNKEGHRFKAGDVGNPNGRPPLLCNVLKNLPADAQEKAYSALWTAMSQPDVKSAKEFLEKSAEELPECGFALQVAVKALMGNKGWDALMDIYDRLWGRPRQTTEIDGTFNLTPPPIIIEKGDDDD
jgi:hypothetical protein